MRLSLLIRTSSLSALISGNDILQLVSGPDLSLVSTNYLIVELFEHSPWIQEDSRLSREEVLDLLTIVVGRVRFVEHGMISVASWIEARRLTRDVDCDDIAFVALTLELDGRLWTRDRKLKEHLIRNGFDRFFEPISYA